MSTKSNSRSSTSISQLLPILEGRLCSSLFDYRRAEAAYFFLCSRIIMAAILGAYFPYDSGSICYFYSGYVTLRVACRGLETVPIISCISQNSRSCIPIKEYFLGRSNRHITPMSRPVPIPIAIDIKQTENIEPIDTVVVKVTLLENPLFTPPAKIAIKRHPTML